MIPTPILQQLEGTHNISISNSSSVSGGCINSCFKIDTNSESYFLKWNIADRYPKMFESEAVGLDMLSINSSFTIPKVLFCGEANKYSWLLMEYIERGISKKEYWSELGEKLAQMHRVTDTAFGLDHHNYIGSLHQSNTQYSSWTDFFIDQRISPQLKLAIDAGKIDNTNLSKFDKLFKKLANLFPVEPPALLHGDLWSGNLQPDTNGKPCLFDPAVYYGHREMELAFTQLFGGFDQQFYEIYNETYPLSPGFDQRVNIYNLYPLLVHVNLFGGGYVNQVKQIIKVI